MLLEERLPSPQPSTPAIPIAETIAQGTAVAAFEASSLICTLESKEPFGTISCLHPHYFAVDVQIVHKGARKERMNAKPLGQPFTAKMSLSE